MGVIALILPALFSIIFAILKQQVKLYKTSNVKRQGDYAMNIMEASIRVTAKEIYNATIPSGGTQLCSTMANPTSPPGSNLYFYDDQGNWTRYYLSGSTLRRQTNTAGITAITSGSVTVTGFSISCSRSGTYSPPVVMIQYTVTANPVSTRTEERAQMNYQTRVQMRSY